MRVASNYHKMDIEEFEDLVVPHGGHKALLEGRRGFKSLYDIHKFDMPWDKSHNTKPRNKKVGRSLGVRELGVIAEEARLRALEDMYSDAL